MKEKKGEQKLMVCREYEIKMSKLWDMVVIMG